MQMGEVGRNCWDGGMATACTQGRYGKERREKRKAQTNAKTKLRGLSPHANYTDRAAAAGRRS